MTFSSANIILTRLCSVTDWKCIYSLSGLPAEAIIPSEIVCEDVTMESVFTALERNLPRRALIHASNSQSPRPGSTFAH